MGGWAKAAELRGSFHFFQPVVLGSNSVFDVVIVVVVVVSVVIVVISCQGQTKNAVKSDAINKRPRVHILVLQSRMSLILQMFN